MGKKVKKKTFVECYSEIEEEFFYKENLMKSLQVLDIIREGESLSIREALDILDDAKAILLEFKMA